MPKKKKVNNALSVGYIFPATRPPHTCTQMPTSHIGEQLHTHLLSNLGAKWRKGRYVRHVLIFLIYDKITEEKHKNKNESWAHKTLYGLEPACVYSLLF